MKKLTKLMLTLALLAMGVTGAKAEKLTLTFETPDYCAASWDASTNTLTWGSGGWNTAWTFMTASGINGDLSSWETLHLNAKNFTNSVAEELTVVFKKNDGSNPPSGPTKEFVVSPDANGDITIDLTNVEWGQCDITNIQDLTIYGGARVNTETDASVVVTDAYLERADPELQDRPEPAEPAAPKRGTLIMSYDYSTATSYPWYRQGAPEGSSYDVKDGKLVITNTVSQEYNWSLQPFILDQIPLKKGTDYVVRIKMNTTGAGKATINMGTWGSNRYNNFSFADAYAYYDVTLNDFPLTTDAENVAHALFQCGEFIGKVAIYKVEVYELAPIQWTNILPEEYSNYFYYSKEAPATSPQASTIDEEGIIEVKSAAKAAENGYEWDSQFWIRIPQILPAGTQFKVSFEGKASEAVNVGTQSHNEPGQYIHWECIGGVDFTDGWQTFEIEATVSDKCDGGQRENVAYLDNFHSVTFNLTKDNAVDYYFRNIKFYVDVNDVTLPDYNFYLSGSMNSWTPTEDYQLVANPEADGEYMITMDFEAGDKFKIVKGANEVWYPEAEDYTINEAGNYTVYFRPSGNGGDDWFYNVIYLTRNYTATLTTNLGWEHVYAYAWTGEGADKVEQLGSWNEKKYEMTENAAGVYELSFKAGSAPANIIFHNGDGQQTSNLAFEDGKAYTWSKFTETVTYTNVENWNKVHAFAWTEGVKNYNGEWPGAEINKVNGVYTYSVENIGEEADIPESIIFNNGDMGDYNQTLDLAFEDGKEYTDGSYVTVNVSEAGYATFCCDRALDFSNIQNLTAYTATLTGSNVSFNKVEASVPAENGLLIKGVKGQETSAKVPFLPGGELSAIQNALIGVLIETPINAGFVLLNGDAGVGFYKVGDAGFTVRANSAYIPAIDGARTFIGFDFNDNTTTAIEGVATVKENNGEVYNLQGQRVTKAQKGLYIINGKKVLVK
ncbi:MAG: starch-binding protein [Prevotella sp.]|nr:starch-binding protein [Prevotella sp.]MBR4364620.1 starch-binding protein [Prevotella sp.]MBR6188226.1 starch-binding protein [Prevotella sp.]